MAARGLTSSVAQKESPGYVKRPWLGIGLNMKAAKRLASEHTITMKVRQDKMSTQGA